MPQASPSLFNGFLRSGCAFGALSSLCLWAAGSYAFAQTEASPQPSGAQTLPRTESAKPGASPAPAQTSEPTIKGTPASEPLMSSQGSSFPLQANSASLDAGWQIRAKIHPDILAFLRTKPKVADDFEVLSKVARLAYYGASFAVSKDASKDKLEIGQYGYEIADRARKLNPKRVEGHYWFAVNYGIYGTAKGVMASLGGAKDMKEALDQAIGIDPAFHFGGPHRIRGRLYFKLPGGFISFGDKKKALEDMKKAIEVAPNMRLNYMWLAEVQAKVENDAIALKTLEKTRELPAVAGDEEEAAYKRDIAALEKDLR